MSLAADLLEGSLAEPIGKSAEMVHVRVRKRDGRHAEHCSRALSDVERNIKLRDLNDGLFAGNADSLHAIGREIEKAKLALTGGGAGKHGRNSFVSAFARTGCG